MKAQASIEMMTTVGIVLAFMVPMSLLLFAISSQNFEEVSKSQADVTVKKIANLINTVYLESDGAKKIVLVNLPSNTQSMEISNGEVIVNLSISGGISESTYPILTKKDGASILSNSYYTDKKGLFWLTIKNIGHEVFLND